MADAILDRLSSGKPTFDRALDYRVISYGAGKATLVDQAGTIAIMSADRQGRPGVTTDLNVSYLAGAPVGTAVVAVAEVLKIGKTLAFVTVDIRRKSDDALVAQGRMTKFQGG